MAFALTCPAFGEGSAIPVRHTCDGDDVSPPLAWRDAPAGTQTFALICDDPDAPAGTWVHWVLYNLPASTSELPENVAKVRGETTFGVRATRAHVPHRVPRTATSSSSTPSTPRCQSRRAL